MAEMARTEKIELNGIKRVSVRHQVFILKKKYENSERQMEGIAKAKKAEVYKGRKPSIDRDELEKLKKKGLCASEIASQFGIARSSVYRIVGG